MEVLQVKKELIRTDDYAIFEDGSIVSDVPLTNICYELALSISNAKMGIKNNGK